MAELPDINTSEVSFIAFWNAIDSGGVSSIEPEDALTDGSIQNYTLYDNGWEGDYSLENGRTAKVRIKSDGWLVAYLDRTEYYDQSASRPDVNGPWDAFEWNVSGDTFDITNNSLERAIASLQGQLSNSGDIGYVSGDVGLYDYSRSDYTGWAVYTTYLSGSTKTYGLLHTGVTIEDAVLLGSADSGFDSSAHIDWDPNDTSVRICSSGNIGVLNTTQSQTDILASDTEHETYVNARQDTNTQGSAQATHLIWYR